MPKSSVRKKKVYTPPVELRPLSPEQAKKPSPVWVPITGVVLIVFSILWLTTYYLTGGFFDLGTSFLFLAELEDWNLVFGFAAMVAALVVFTKWR